ncbi:hypothetical protein MMC13_003813 [Lambiella insularis]|nr:hypothetical protein [Lambiella insularis]
MNSLPPGHQTQGHVHQQQQAPQPNGSDLEAASYNYPNHQQNDSFNYFNNNAASSFASPWAAEAVIDPRIQSNVFAQTPSAWQPNNHSAPNTSTYGLQSTSYNNAYSRPQDPYTYPDFHHQQPLSFADSSYDPTLGYTDPLLDADGFGDHDTRGYARSSVQGQTISPSALQSYPYPQFAGTSDDQVMTTDASLAFNMQLIHGQVSQPRNDSPPAVRSAGVVNRSPQQPYDDERIESLASSIPAGLWKNSVSLKDYAALVDGTKSKNFTGFVFLGQKPVDADDSRVVLPKVVRRKSLRDVRQEVLTDQGSDSWNIAQQPLAKKLKVSRAKHLRLQSNGSAMGSGVHQTQSESSSASASESGSEDDSEYSSESGDQAEADEPSPLPLSRPIDSAKALEYDVVKTVWHKRNARVVPSAIRTALANYLTIIKGVRDDWKAEMAALAQAEEKKNEAQIQRCKNRVVEQRSMLETAFRLTLQHGHRDIIERFGEITPLIVAFAQLITDRIKDGDYNGPLLASILQLMARCVSLDQKLIEVLKLDKALPKLVKRSEERLKVLAQRILTNAEQHSRQKSGESKISQAVDVSKSGTSSVSSSLGRSLERQRDAAAPAVIVPKKGTSVISTKLSAQNLAKTAGTSSKGVLPGKESSKPSNTSALPTAAPKIKVNHVTTKPSVFSSLQSASKKPGTSNAAQKAAQQVDTKGSKSMENRVAVSTPAAAAPKPAFSFAETMANLTKPKEAPPTTKTEENRPPETKEEKKKRLRKEERRKLRVSFKPDDSLTEVRTFVHDPEEEMGHDDSMIRDVGDVSSEGRMLKMHKDLDGLDDDDDGVGGEEELRPWITPSLVDFSVVEADELARNCTTRGGQVEVKSQERAVQEQRELTTLMSYYPTFSDVPSSPREPIDPYSGEKSVERAFGTPHDETKRRERQYYAAQLQQARQPNPVPATTPQAPDISVLLQILNNHQPAPAPPAAPPQHQYPVTQPQSNGLEAIFAQFSGNQPARTQPVAQQQYGHLDPSIQAALAAVNQPSYVQPTYAPPPPVQNSTPDLQALLSQLGRQTGAQQPNFNYQAQYQNDASRKRQYNHDEGRHDDQYSAGKVVRGNNGKKFNADSGKKGNV